MSILFFIIYSLALAVTALYSLLQLHLLYFYLRSRKKATLPMPAHSDWPVVTVQLPVFNEKYVVTRLIEQVLRMDYPSHLLQVQVLDDSTDETTAIVARLVTAYRQRGFQIFHLHRPHRRGFKAGALKEALPLAQGDFIAIFDADFLPPADFLKRTLPFIQLENTGVVQARWGHLNGGYSLLTRLQALQLNVHFGVEQQGRQAGGFFLQFNGTAGVWRRQAIEAAGGWAADTLTEDLDLSIRAQLQGWRIVYLDQLTVPAELPAEMNGLKSQQFRWMKGGAQTARKLLPAVWKAKIGFFQKIHATLQLLGSTIFVWVLVLALSSLPVFFQPVWWPFFCWGMVGFVPLLLVQFVANVHIVPEKKGYFRRCIRFAVLYPLFVAMSMGLCLHNAVAVLEGWGGRASGFVRTPKFDIRRKGDSFENMDYLAARGLWLTVAEGVLSLVFSYFFFAGLVGGKFGFLWLHGLLAAGFGLVFFYSLRSGK